MGTSDAFPSSSGGEPERSPDAEQRRQQGLARWLPLRSTLANVRGLAHAVRNALWQMSAEAKGHGRAVWKAMRQARGPVATQESESWLETFRRWSPAVVPAAFGTLLLLGAALLASQHDQRGAPLIAPHTLVPLFLLYLLFGTLYGALLYFARDAVVWMAVLAGGAALDLLLTAGVIWGLVGIIVVAVLEGALATLYTRKHLHEVADGRVEITACAGAYQRTLQPGVALLLPGERVLTTLETGEQRFTCQPQQVRMQDENGEIYVARAAATAVYRLVPSETHQAVLASAHWEAELRSLIGTMLEEALERWAIQMLTAEEEAPERLLAKSYLRALRERARARGVHIVSVSVQNIWLTPESETIPMERSLGEEREQPGQVGQLAQVPAPNQLSGAPSRPGPTLPAAPPPREVGAATPTPGTPGAAPAQATPPPPPLPDALAPEALSDAYEAIRAGRVTDPATIRAVANGFLTVAADPERNAASPYDALAAARILLDLAADLERQRGASSGASR